MSLQSLSLQQRASALMRKHHPGSKLDHFICPKSCIGEIDVGKHKYLQYVLVLNCNVCNSMWYICKECSYQRSILSDETKLTRHLWKKHKSYLEGFKQWKKASKVSKFDSFQIFDENFIDSYYEELDTNNITMNDINLDKKWIDFSQIEKKNADYFEYDFKNEGGAYLVARANFKNRSVIKHLNQTDIKMNLRFSDLAFDLSKSHLTKLSKYLKDASYLHIDGRDAQDDQWLTKLPKSYQKIRHTYLDSANAVLPNIPFSKGIILDDHGYFSPSSILEVVLGLGYDIHFLPPFDLFKSYYQSSNLKRVFLQHSKIVQEYAKSRVLCTQDGSRLHITCFAWMDDADTSSGAKKGRNKIWVFTMSLASHTSKNCSSNTYVVAFGPKGDVHDCIFKKFAEDIKEINGPNKWFYSKEMKAMIQVHIDVIAFLADSPEFHDMKHLCRGNGTYTSVRGYLLETKAVWDKIVACNDCFSALMKPNNVWKNKKCTKCVCWNVGNDKYGILSFDPPKKFPEVGSNWLDNGKLNCRKISNNQLKASFDLAHDNYIRGIWSYDNADTYLKVSGIKESIREELLEHADNIICLNKINSMQSSGENTDYVLEDYRNNPENYQKCEYPPTWDDLYDVSLQIVAPMHTLCLNVIKNTHDIGMEFASSRRKQSPLCEQMNKQLCEISDMKLDWLKLLPDFGGWVSENWLAYGRILRWVYSSLDDIAPNYVFVRPNKPIHMWLSVECDNYLRYYGFERNGNVCERRERITTIENDPNIFLQSPEERIGSTASLYDVMQALSIAWSYAMAENVDEETIEQADRHFRIFLSMTEKLTSKLYPNNIKSKLESSYSYLAVLEIVTIMSKYGCVRNVWEGSYQGEGILKELKPIISDLRMNWHVNAGERHHKKKSLKRILETYVEKDTSFYQSINVCKYENQETVIEMFENRKSLSVFHHNKNGYFILIEGGKKMKLHLNDFKVEHVGLSYFEWSIGYVSDVGNAMAGVDFFAVLLPYIKHNLLEELNGSMSWYAMVTSDHMELLNDGSIGKNDFSNTNYSAYNENVIDDDIILESSDTV